MGLDNYASRFPENVVLTHADIEAFESADLQLCGGMMSGEAGSFRGKVYDSLVTEVTGESIYSEWLPPGTVRHMAEQLARHTPSELASLNDELRGGRSGPTSEQEMADLQRFFAICAEQGLGLIGWS